VKPLAVLDTECYRNFWLCKVRRLDTGAVREFQQYDGKPLDRARLHETLSRVTIITFNGRKYDMPMIGFALRGADCVQLKRCSDFIIQGQMQPWDAERQFAFETPTYDHIDMIEVAPGMVSLKVYMGKMFCQKMQDLPIEHDAEITPEQRDIISRYNDNDLDGTEALYRKFEKQIDLRVAMGKEYGIDLRSKSDAQIAEAVIKSRLTEITGNVPRKPQVSARAFKFRFPKFLRHAGPIVQGVIANVREADFIVDPAGYVKMPEQLSKAKIVIGGSTYKMGIGGLHSTEQSSAHVADDSHVLIDRDVASFYPAIIILTELYPRHLGRPFLDLFTRIRDERIVAKREGNKAKADMLKICVNAAFGKMGNPWSILYSPELLIQTTVTGQLVLLMLIEHIEAAGIPVASANTDGIVMKCPTTSVGHLGTIISTWEHQTGFETEETRYAGLYSRDVNSYIALKTDGGVKLKGDYAEPEPVASSWPSPHNQVCVAAVVGYLQWGFDIEHHIRAESDVRQFLEVRNVTGGATWRGEYLGRAVRWYHAIGGDPIYYKKANKTGGHNKVANTDSSRPMMDLTTTVPADLDHQWYVDEAYRILELVGVKRVPT